MSTIWLRRSAAIVAAYMLSSAATAQSIPADTVTSTGDQTLNLNFSCLSDISAASDGSTSRLGAICPRNPINPDFSINFGFSPEDTEMLTAVRVWANGGNIYSDHELRQFDLEVDHFDPETGQVETLQLDNVQLGDTLNDSDPKTVDLPEPLFRVSEVRISDLVGLTSGNRRRPTFREFQGVFTAMPLTPEITVASGTTGDINHGGTDPQGTQLTATEQTVTYTVRNTGTGPLTLSGTPTAENLNKITGPVMISAPAQSVLQPGETTSFDVTYVPTDDGPFSFDVSIANDDSDESQFDVTVSGTGNNAPTATITGPSGPQGDPFMITVTFSEDVSGFELDDLALINGTASNLTMVSAGVYTVMITPVTQGQNVTINLLPGSVVDSDGATNAEAAAFMATSGALASDLSDAVRDIIIEEAVKTTRASLQDHQRFVRGARERFTAERACRADDLETAMSDEDLSDCGALYDHVPLRFSGDIEVTQNSSFVAGSFFGMTGSLTDQRRRLISGDFNITRFDGQETLATFTGRIAWEAMETEDVLVGTFISGMVEQSDINDDLDGTRMGYGLQAGAYFVEALDRDLYLDGFIAAGVGQNQLDIGDGFFEIEGDYLTPTVQAGMAISGEREFDHFILRPELSLAYGYTSIGDVDLTVSTPTSEVADGVDAGDLYLGLLQFTPEVLVPLNVSGDIFDAAELRVAPTLTCEVLTTTERTEDCGGGLELELSAFSDDGLQEISARISREVIGNSERDSFGLTLARRF
ncbi:MAG: Ig-like domain-containing protein [Pseudomonadota bacterium]